MDRFIEVFDLHLCTHSMYLKSSMDRFIAKNNKFRCRPCDYLKSSMDRFIGRNLHRLAIDYLFKIQYG